MREPKPGFEGPGFRRVPHPCILEQCCWACTAGIMASSEMETLGQPPAGSVFQQPGRQLVRGCLLGQVFRQIGYLAEEKSSQARDMGLGSHECSETLRKKYFHSLKLLLHHLPPSAPIATFSHYCYDCPQVQGQFKFKFKFSSQLHTHTLLLPGPSQSLPVFSPHPSLHMFREPSLLLLL